eukprot:CAMPEP_0119275312 /NCGR_PEP_ID=MMETSP1329-20130426/13592_1 /TAXON_ID=114041 /ORGANISM="Genus nov. species nov., Strain RCC1024" /LENGTH=302 /DNA_ID=CAMNT_0007275689 /DNA_START=63 /DNA_END=968 /DNA_ORIENTATION=-
MARGRLALQALSLATAAALTPLPTGINTYEVSSGVRANPREQLQSIARGAIAAAREDGVTLAEIEYPDLLGEKTQFDDVDNVQILDANRDWAMTAMAPLAGEIGKELWMAFPDRKELELARDEWPGERFGAATLTTLEDAAEVLSGGSEAAWGAALARGAEGLFGTSNLGAKPDTASAPPPSVVFAVQPGEGGPLEDWLNLERCVPKDGGLLVSLNGAFDKLRGGYYPRLLFPKLADCVDRFIADAEGCVVLKPLAEKGKSGWLWRVYPEPWQLIAQGRTEACVVSTSESRPPYAELIAALL